MVILVQIVRFLSKNCYFSAKMVFYKVIGHYFYILELFYGKSFIFIHKNDISFTIGSFLTISLSNGSFILKYCC